MPLVLVRTPTYQRPDLLKRSLGCLQRQTHQDWICEVRDDCPEGSARHVVEEMNDPRIVHVWNRPQKFMIENLDACFLNDNPYGADYFFMLEDDNQVAPAFMQRGMEILQQMDVNVCQMNQAIEFRGGDKAGTISDFGIFDGIYDERVHEPREIRLALFGWASISNGSLFWSRNIRNELAYRTGNIPGVDEALRTMMLRDRIYISLERLAVWAKDEKATTRNLGFGKSRLRRELDMQATAKKIRRIVWRDTPKEMRRTFLDGGILRIPVDKRHHELQRAGIRVPKARAPFSLVKSMKVRAVRLLGNVHPSVKNLDLGKA